MVKLNLIFVIIVSCYNTNQNASIKEFNDIIANIKPKDYVDTGLIKSTHEKINIIIDKIKKRDLIITLVGYDIVDKSKVYEIENIKIENGGNWHDGYFSNWTASLIGETELFIIVFTVWGEKTETYAEKIQ